MTDLDRKNSTEGCAACNISANGYPIRDCLGSCDRCDYRAMSIDYLHTVGNQSLCEPCAYKAGHFKDGVIELNPGDVLSMPFDGVGYALSQIDRKNSTIIVIPHDIAEPCFAIIEGQKIDIANEIDILTIQREARERRLASVDRTKGAVTR